MAVDETTVDKMDADEITIDEMAVDIMAVDEMTVDVKILPQSDFWNLQIFPQLNSYRFDTEVNPTKNILEALSLLSVNPCNQRKKIPYALAYHKI